MDVIEFTVPAVPVAQPRARATTINGKARMFGAKKEHPVHSFKATVRLACQAAYEGAPIDGPLSMTIDMVFPRPGRLVWKTRPMPRVRHVGKPDFDNLAKSVCDALNGLLWVDDSQICDGAVRKWYAAGDEQPHVRIVVERLSCG